MVLTVAVMTDKMVLTVAAMTDKMVLTVAAMTDKMVLTVVAILLLMKSSVRRPYLRGLLRQTMLKLTLNLNLKMPVQVASGGWRPAA